MNTSKSLTPFKLITPVAILLAVLVGGVWMAYAGLPNHSGSPLPPISRVQEMNALATLRVQIDDSLKGENENWEVHWILHGEAVLGVDLSQATYSSVDEANRAATLSLPHSHVISSKIDHNRSGELRAISKKLIPLSGRQSLRDEVWKHADEKVAELAHHDGYLQAAELNAERNLTRLFQDAGWSISCEWR